MRLSSRAAAPPRCGWRSSLCYCDARCWICCRSICAAACCHRAAAARGGARAGAALARRAGVGASQEERGSSAGASCGASAAEAADRGGWVAAHQGSAADAAAWRCADGPARAASSSCLCAARCFASSVDAAAAAAAPGGDAYTHGHFLKPRCVLHRIILRPSVISADCHVIRSAARALPALVSPGGRDAASRRARVAPGARRAAPGRAMRRPQAVARAQRGATSRSLRLALACAAACLLHVATAFTLNAETAAANAAAAATPPAPFDKWAAVGSGPPLWAMQWTAPNKTYVAPAPKGMAVTQLGKRRHYHGGKNLTIAPIAAELRQMSGLWTDDHEAVCNDGRCVACAGGRGAQWDLGRGGRQSAARQGVRRKRADACAARSTGYYYFKKGYNPGLWVMYLQVRAKRSAAAHNPCGARRASHALWPRSPPRCSPPTPLTRARYAGRPDVLRRRQLRCAAGAVHQHCCRASLGVSDGHLRCHGAEQEHPVRRRQRRLGRVLHLRRLDRRPGALL